jgi:hypothetical protein
VESGDGGGGEEKKTEKEEEAEAIEGDSVWQCEFCGHANQIELDDEEVPTTTHHAHAIGGADVALSLTPTSNRHQVPKAESLDYLLEPAPVASDATENNLVFVIGTFPYTLKNSRHFDESEGWLTIGFLFCADISGSMCVSTEVPGKVQLKGMEKRRQDFADFLIEGDQFMPGQRRDVTYISRLQVPHDTTQAPPHTTRHDTRACDRVRADVWMWPSRIVRASCGSEPAAGAEDQVAQSSRGRDLLQRRRDRARRRFGGAQDLHRRSADLLRRPLLRRLPTLPQPVPLTLRPFFASRHDTTRHSPHTTRHTPHTTRHTSGR